MPRVESSSNEVDYLSDPDRLRALHQLNILDSGAEDVFDLITKCARDVFGVKSATLHIVDDQRQWVKACSDGVRAGDTAVGETFCQYTIRNRDGPLFVPDLTQDPLFCDSAFVTGPSALRFYAGMPLIARDGSCIGTLCLLDTRPNAIAELDDCLLKLFRNLADIAVKTMELRGSHAQARSHFLQTIEEDGVTGLMSRRGLLFHLQQVAEDAPVNGLSFAMIKIRIKGLDRILRAYGSPTSNQIIQQATERIQLCINAEDHLARVGDHSLLLASTFQRKNDGSDEYYTHDWGQSGTEKVVQLLEQPFIVENESFHVAADIGVACSSEDGASPYSVLEQVEGAAFEAERDKMVASHVQWSNGKLDILHRDGLTIERRLRKAIAEETLTVVFQPIVNLNANNMIVGAEALVRWPQEHGAPIGPDFFIPLAEELGLIDKLGLWVFAQACKTLRYWRDVSGRDLWMAVNFAPKQLEDSRLAGKLLKITSEVQVSPKDIKIEITESGLIEHFEQVAQLLRVLTEAGFKLALDDFGTGHSSLSRLIHLPFNVLKVDRAFVSDSPDGAGAAVVSSLATLAQSLGLETVGEGIETKAQEDFLKSNNYHLGQGYLYSKPVTADAFLELAGFEGC